MRRLLPLLLSSLAPFAFAFACSSGTDSSIDVAGDASTIDSATETPDTGIAPSVDSSTVMMDGGAVSSVSLSAGGVTRTFLLFAPTVPSAAPRALVFAFHGDGGTGASMMSEFPVDRASGSNAVVIYPDGINRGWDVDHPENELPFFDAMLAHAQAVATIDPVRVFVTGYSSGGYMANQLGCLRGNVLRGIAAQSGGGPYLLGGTFDAKGNLVCPTPPPAALIIHGQSDPTVAPSEGSFSFEYWSYRNECGNTASVSTPLYCEAADGCAKQSVARCLVPGMGHQIWANAPEAVWGFFSGL